MDNTILSGDKIKNKSISIKKNILSFFANDSDSESGNGSETDNDNFSIKNIGSKLTDKISSKFSNNENSDTKTDNTQTDNTESDNTKSNSIMKNIGQFFINILFSIATGILGFFKANWIWLSILIILWISVYFLYSKVISGLDNFVKTYSETVLPFLNSTLDVLGKDNKDNKENEDNQNNSDNIDTSTYTNREDIVINSLTREDIGIEDSSLESTITPNNRLKNEVINDVNHEDDVDDNNMIPENITESNNNHAIGYDGYCFIGNNQNNVRTCARVYRNNKCMSGEIFPSLQICMNPELRE